MKKYRASDLEIKEVEDDLDFLNENHYQGWVPANIKYGLYDKNELLIEMTFGKPRFNRRYDWELLRLCTKKDCQVYGGASKLFKYFCENNSGSIISYCNLSLFSGKVYEALGFTKRAEYDSYHYEKDGKKYHRANFQKHKLVKTYPEYKNKTEKEIMQILGFTRVEEIQSTWTYGDKWYIYQITDLRNGKTYIGQHLDRDDDYWGSGTIISREVSKYGKENFKKEILVDNVKSQEEADTIEIDLIKKAKEIGKAEYNIITDRFTPKSSHIITSTGWKRKQESVAKMVATRKSKDSYKVSEETKRRISEAKKGSNLSEETKKKISEAQIGHKDYCSEEGHKKQSESLKKYYETNTVWNKGKKGTQAAWNKGKTLSEEQKEKMRKCKEAYKLSGRKDWNVFQKEWKENNKIT